MYSMSKNKDNFLKSFNLCEITGGHILDDEFRGRSKYRRNFFTWFFLGI